MLGSQVSCPLQEVTAHSAGLGVLQGAGLARLGWAGAGDHLPPGGKVTNQAGPVASSLGVGRRSLPSPFCACFLPLTRLLLMHFPETKHLPSSGTAWGCLPEPVHVSEPHRPESSWGSARKEPGSSRRSLRKAHIPS